MTIDDKHFMELPKRDESPDPDLPNWERWNQRPVVTVLQAVALSFGINPDSVDSPRINSAELYTLWGKGVKVRLDTIESWTHDSVEVGRLHVDRTWANETIDRRGDFLENAGVNVADFISFCDRLKWEVPPEFRRNCAVLRTNVWPWGGYSTSALEILADTATKFWAPWNGDAKTMPRKKVIKAYLEAKYRSVSDHTLNSVALILNPRPPTPRPKGSKKNSEPIGKRRTKNGTNG
jgi:hypothetical protein